MNKYARPKPYEKVTQYIVNCNLNNAFDENEYKEIIDWTAKDIAFDLMAYSEDFDHTGDVDEIVPLIEVWLKQKKCKHDRVSGTAGFLMTVFNCIDCGFCVGDDY
jgi:hypothetical protein